MFYKLIADVLSDHECQTIINHGLSLELKEMHTYTSGKHEKGIDTSFNKRKGVFFENPDWDPIADRVIGIINAEKIFSGITYTDINRYLFNRYEVTDFLNYHMDIFEIQRGATITVIYQLNDDYEGGDFNYIIDGVEYTLEKKRGSVFIFDSVIQHRVQPVTGGIRYSLNNWPKHNRSGISLF